MINIHTLISRHKSDAASQEAREANIASLSGELQPEVHIYKDGRQTDSTYCIRVFAVAPGREIPFSAEELRIIEYMVSVEDFSHTGSTANALTASRIGSSYWHIASLSEASAERVAQVINRILVYKLLDLDLATF